MSRVIKTILLTALVVFGSILITRATAFDGPIGNGGDAWQVTADGFGPPVDDVAPKNLGEGYRRNVPVLYYACDANFLGYFGTSGKLAIDNTFNILNKVFTNNATGKTVGLDGYGAGLSEFPLETRHFNYQAQALGLFDLKSFALGEMMQQLGLADPVRYTWGINNWYHTGTIACPVGQNYYVVQRNFDYISSPSTQIQYSPYVNDVLYTYQIVENCTGPDPIRYALPLPVDFLADAYSPVASYATYGLDWGGFYTGLTRDDVAGLRYLLRANNINWETVSPDSLQYVITTNTANPTVFPPYITGINNFLTGTNGGYYVGAFTNAAGNIVGGYGDLAGFSAFITTNGPAAVQAAYPGIAILSVSNTVTIVSNATYSVYYTNPPVGSPYGAPPVLVVATNYNKVFEILYYYKFANIFTNHNVRGSQLLVSVQVGTPIGSPYGSPGVTNTTARKIPAIQGDFFILPQFYTNYCPIDILPYGSIPTVQATTNLVSAVTTNTVTTNLTAYAYLVTYFTNYSYVIAPVTCSITAGATGLYEGIEKLQFVGTNFDSLLGQFFNPITNNYTMKYITNGQVQVQYFQRIATQPDFLFSAQNLTPGPNVTTGVPVDQRTQPPFDTANVLPNLAGPGTILSPSTISFNKSGPVYFNSFATTLTGSSFFTEFGLDSSVLTTSDLYYSEYFLWSSFDGTTNAPVVYPNGTSIENLEDQILVSITPTVVPMGHLGMQYPSLGFTATSTFFAQPFTWSATGLPAGLNVSPSGTLSGTPLQSGSFVFTLTLTDSTSRSVQWYYPLTIQ